MGFAVLIASSSAAGEEPPSFNRDVRPILSAKCFNCHGPDEESREAELRLDSFAEATRALEGNHAIVPGRPDESELFARITTDDEDLLMPPADSNKTLTTKEIAILKRWIATGAKYEQHWAYVAPKRLAVPQVKNTGWPRNAVDRFVLRKLEAAGLQPSTVADRRTLIRRLSLDLVGLPPTPEEVDAFLADESPDAWEKLVDRLLESPRYGERWARRWLDLARYSDTNGYEKDRPRSMWPYRDWVIGALNADMPFDQFTIEQIAGDMLPGATLAQKTATGFHRNTMLNEEGGIDPLEYRFHAMTDRVSSTGTTWLGLTLSCCQCHTHKFDPFTQREYYQLMAFLNNTDEPDLDLPDQAIDDEHARNLKRAARLLVELPPKWPADKGSLDEKFASWLKQQRAQSVAWTVLRPVKTTSNLPLLTVEADDSVFVSGDTTKADTYRLTYAPKLPNITAIRLEALPDERLPAHGPEMAYYEGPKGDFFLGELQLSVDGKPAPFKSASESYAKNRFGKNPVSAALASDGDPQTGWTTAERPGERHTAIFVLSEPLPAATEFKLTMMFGRHFAASLGRFRISVTTDSREPKARDLPAKIETLLAIADERLTTEQRTRLREQFLLTAPELAEPSKQIRQLRKRRAYPTTLVMRERPAESPRPTHLHKRGEYLSPTDRVIAKTPEALHPLPSGTALNRLGFAQWLVARDNPLTARVVANRQWAAFFGRGIVQTVDDFGYTGIPPTHPELLDWLAVEFMQNGWSLKQLHKAIVMSATYRQSSTVTPEGLEKDPLNELLSRAPRPRLEAEVLRDAALHAVGLLSMKAGGPGVRPPQPAGVTEVAYGKPRWNASTGDDRYRRSIYTFSKRTAPFAMFSTFDAPSGEACIARRDVSNTPLQVLTLLNDVMFVEAAQALGTTLSAQNTTDVERLRFAYRRLLSRKPDETERRLFASFIQRQRTRFEQNQEAAKVLAGDGSGTVVERAVWTAVARTLLSLDETLTRN